MTKLQSRGFSCSIYDFAASLYNPWHAPSVSKAPSHIDEHLPLLAAKLSAGTYCTCTYLGAGSESSGDCGGSFATGGGGPPAGDSGQP